MKSLVNLAGIALAMGVSLRVAENTQEPQPKESPEWQRISEDKLRRAEERRARKRLRNLGSTPSEKEPAHD